MAYFILLSKFIRLTEIRNRRSHRQCIVDGKDRRMYADPEINLEIPSHRWPVERSNCRT